MKSITFLLCGFLSFSAWAADNEVALTIKDHRYTPNEIRVPAGKKIKLVISNLDTTPEEFESHDLNREKIVPGGGKISVFIGPLKPGRYTFIGEYHKDTAQGAVIAE